MPQHRLLQRFPAHEAPALAARLYEPGSHDSTFDWTWAVPYVFQALADPQRARFPHKPSAGTQHTSSPVFGYWTALQGYLTYVLGWRRHDLGLQWWLDEGRDGADHPVLDLLRSVWDDDGSIEHYLAWVMSAPDWRNPTSIHPFQPETEFHNRDPKWDRWALTGPLNGVDPQPPAGLHLEQGDHLQQVEGVDGDHRWYTSDQDHAALEVAHFGAAFRLLRKEAGPAGTSSRSLRVRVFARDVGFLGEYRRSWASGLWFSGPHRYHQVGI